MKLRHSLAFLATLLCLGCRSASLVPAFGAGTDALVDQTRAFNQAFAERDTAKIDSFLAPGYVFHFIDQNMQGALSATPNAPRGRWGDKLLERFSNGPLESSIVDARVYRDLGIVVTYYKWRGAFSGTPFEYTGYITDVWIRRHGKWSVLTSHATLLSAR